MNATETTKPETSVFRIGSTYSRIYNAVRKTEGKPTTKNQIIAYLKKNHCKEPEVKLLYGLNVILSVTQDGKAHPRLNKKAVASYWIERRCDGIFVYHRR